jgi:hypothetical protein
VARRGTPRQCDFAALLWAEVEERARLRTLGLLELADGVYRLVTLADQNHEALVKNAAQQMYITD